MRAGPCGSRRGRGTHRRCRPPLRRAETLRQATGAALSPVEQAIQDRFLPRVGAELGEEALKREHAAGGALTPEEVVALALASKPAAAQTVASPVSPV